MKKDVFLLAMFLVITTQLMGERKQQDFLPITYYPEARSRPNSKGMDVTETLPVTSMPEVVLPDLKDCACGLPMGTLGAFKLGANWEEACMRMCTAEQKRRHRVLKHPLITNFDVMFDGDKCLLGASRNEGKITGIHIEFFIPKGMTLEQLKTKMLHWVELLEKKYGIEMIPYWSDRSRWQGFNYEMGFSYSDENTRNPKRGVSIEVWWTHGAMVMTSSLDRGMLGETEPFHMTNSERFKSCEYAARFFGRDAWYEKRLEELRRREGDEKTCSETRLR